MSTLRSMVAGGVVVALLPMALVPATATTTASAGRAPARAASWLAGQSNLRAKPQVPRLVWRKCGDGFQCATAKVPLDYNRPRGRLIALALVRLPATDRQHRIGSLFVNPGGPGGSGVSEVRNSGKALFSPAVRARFDIVGMDPRGVGGSTPVRCFRSFDESIRAITLLRSAPANRAQYRERVAAARDFARRCAARNGDLLQHLSTANVARDLDLLRQAVGDRGLTYDGISYGTYLGVTYAAMFPQHVRALVLDGNFDPAYRSGGRTAVLRENGHLGGWPTLRQYFRLCAAAGPSRCAFAAGGQPARKYVKLVARVRRSPITLPDGRRFDYGTLLSSTFEGLYSAQRWSITAQTLQDLYTAGFDVAARQRRLPADTATAAEYNNVGDAQLAIMCGETRNPRRPDRYPRIAARADRTAPYAGTWVTWVSFGCTFWKARDADRYTGSFRTRPAYPALVLNNRYDPITPAQNAFTVARLLAGSRVLISEGWGHTTLFNSGPCDSLYRERYLIDRALPVRGATCKPGVVPFRGP